MNNIMNNILIIDSWKTDYPLALQIPKCHDCQSLRLSLSLSENGIFNRFTKTQEPNTIPLEHPLKYKTNQEKIQNRKVSSVCAP